MKKEILELLYTKYRVDFSLESDYTDFGMREEDFESLANDIILLVDKFKKKEKIKSSL